MKSPALDDLLQRIGMFADLPPWQLEVVTEAVETVDVKVGHVIVERGSDDGFTYFLTEGEILLEAADGQDKQVAITEETARAPIANLRPRMFGVRAVTRVRGLRIPDIVLSAAGCSTQGGAGAFRVESQEEDERRRAESRLSFHLYRDLKNDAAILPSLPDLALRIRKAIDDDVSDARAISRLVEADPAMAAKLMKAANSALYGGLGNVETTSSAVVRLGFATTRQLVLGFALKEVFRTKDPMIRERLQALWKHSAHIAALAFVLARDLKGLNPEEALLAGLVHDVGAIPILNYARKYRELTQDAESLELTIQRLRGELGAMILRDWRFPAPVVAAARDAENWLRVHHGKADFTDLLIVAQVHDRLRRKACDGLPEFSEISAVGRVLGEQASAEKSLEILQRAKERVNAMRSVLHA